MPDLPVKHLLPLLTMTLIVALSGCGGATALDEPWDGGVDASHDGAAGTDAKLEGCVSKEGLRLCGRRAECYHDDGVECRCIGAFGDILDPEIGWCAADAPWPSTRTCGGCRDGEVCVHLASGRLGFNEWCTSEDFGQMLWARGYGHLVHYADGTPYTGEPIPSPADCPPPAGGVVTLCGGNCGGCAPAGHCSGRSPTHPWGICTRSALGDCNSARDCRSPSEACLSLGDTLPKVDVMTRWPRVCVPAADCEAIAAEIPGGAVCGY